jgi:hypothetical protein
LDLSNNIHTIARERISDSAAKNSLERLCLQKSKGRLSLTAGFSPVIRRVGDW